MNFASPIVTKLHNSIFEYFWPLQNSIPNLHFRQNEHQKVTPGTLIMNFYRLLTEKRAPNTVLKIQK